MSTNTRLQWFGHKIVYQIYDYIRGNDFFMKFSEHKFWKTIFVDNALFDCLPQISIHFCTIEVVQSLFRQ